MLLKYLKKLLRPIREERNRKIFTEFSEEAVQKVIFSQRRKDTKKISIENQLFDFATSVSLRDIFIISVLFRQPLTFLFKFFDAYCLHSVFTPYLP